MGLVAISTSSIAQENPSRTFWLHNNSVMYLVASGQAREFYYEVPRSGMLNAGARRGSLLFSGKTLEGNYFGTAYIYNPRCGRVPYQVSGPILDNYERVVLRGQAPRFRSDCRVIGYSTDTLIFDLIKSSEQASTANAPLPPSVRSRYGSYGAIAFSSSDGVRGSSENNSSRESAESNALGECYQRGGQDCRIATWERNACAVLAIGNDNVWGADWHSNAYVAERRAIEQCSNVTSGCEAKVWICN